MNLFKTTNYSVTLSLAHEFTLAGSGQLTRLKGEAIITLYGLTVSDAFRDTTWTRLSRTAARSNALQMHKLLL